LVSTAKRTGDFLANEGQSFTVARNTVVKYGAGSSFVQKTVSGTAPCTNAYFGSDPAPFVVKACYFVSGSTTTAPAPSAGGGVAAPNGTIDANAYRATAAVLSKDAGIAFRYGPDAASYGTANTGPALFQRTDTKLTAPAQDIPFYWSVGGPVSGNPGAYSTNQTNVIFAADDPSQRVGVTLFQASAYVYNVFAQLPQLPWQVYTAGQGLDTPNVLGYKAAGIAGSDPIATGRCTGAVGFCSEGVVAFQNGALGTVGSNTASNPATTILAPNKVPTGVAMTNDSEFALVTVWDTVALKGQIAVVALAGLCDGCDWRDSTAHTTNGVSYAAWYQWWHEWAGVYPGLPNMGDIAFMKVLGYVDLPGMAAPTEIAVTTGLHQFNTVLPGGNFMGAENSPLADHWQSFASGGSNYGRYAKGGVAVVISKSEQKVAFVDLKPLFDYVNGTYFSSNVGITSNYGMAANEWPYTFDQAPSQMPTLVKTVSLGAPPTAVRTTITTSPQRAWVATQDGTLHIYSLDGYAPGAEAAVPAPSAIVEVGTVTGIGRNPTSLAASKSEPSGASGDPINEQVIVASRGDNKISWVRFANGRNSGSVVRTIQHDQLTDLVAVEDVDNFANANNVVSVADYGGKAVRNYRYGPVIFSDGGACPAPTGCPVNAINGSVAEYGGALSLPGKPFQMTTANVP
jgi:hypothetical protein